MKVALRITTPEQTKAGALYRRVAKNLGNNRKPLHGMIAAEAGEVTRKHILHLARTRHRTANRLGAQPSGYLGRVAESVWARGTRSAAEVRLTGAGMARAFRRVVIKPRPPRKALTIPVHPEAYDRGARSFPNLKLIVIRPGAPEGRAFAVLARGDGPVLETLYILVRSVTQARDRTLLPPDAVFHDAVARGCKNFLRRLFSGRTTTPDA